MWYVAICDDRTDQLNSIRAATDRYFAQRVQYTVEVTEYSNPFLLLEKLELTGCCDILLLDVCMPGLNGIQVAQEIRNRKLKSQIIFLTTSDEFAVDAFELQAAHYLLKPFTQQQFDEAIERAIAELERQKACHVALRLVGGGIQSVDLQDILYVESAVHTQNVFFANGTQAEVRQTMGQMQEMLNEIVPSQFVCPMKGYIVNLRAILTLQPKQLTLKNGTIVPIARGGFRELQDLYFAFMFPRGGGA